MFNAIQTFKFDVQQYKQVPFSGEKDLGTYSVKDGFKKETVEVCIDMEAILKLLGEKAVRSKGGIAREAKGAVVVKHIR